MNVGTKSLLFGVHQFLWHPLTVWLAWRRLYGSWPNWWQVIAIFCHDVGYAGCPNMDGKEGKQHPFRGAYHAAHIATAVWEFFHPGASEVKSFIFWQEVKWFTLLHSRELSKNLNVEPSKLCWADKYCVCIEPRWLYLWRARMSGELSEYLDNATPIETMLEIKEVVFGREAAEIYWHDWYQSKICNLPEIKKLIQT